MKNFIKKIIAIFLKKEDEKSVMFHIKMQEFYDKMAWGKYGFPIGANNPAVELKKVLEEEKRVGKMLQEFPDGNFQPYAYYNEDMDCIEVYFKDESCITHPLNSELELYKSFDSNEIIGARILGVNKLITSPIDDEIAIANTEQFLEEMIKSMPSGDFQSFVFYNRDGNMIEAYLTNDSYYAKRLAGIDLHLNQDTDEIVGFSIHGIKSLLESKGKFK